MRELKAKLSWISLNVAVRSELLALLALRANLRLFKALCAFASLLGRQSKEAGYRLQVMCGLGQLHFSVPPFSKALFTLIVGSALGRN